MPNIQLGKPNRVMPIVLGCMLGYEIYFLKPWRSLPNAAIAGFFLTVSLLIAAGSLLYETYGAVDETAVRFRRPWGWRVLPWAEVASVSRDPQRTDLILFTLRRGNQWTGKLRFEEGVFLRDPAATAAGIDKEKLILMCNRRCGAA